MRNTEERDAFTSTYKVCDPIQNLKIRVYLRHVKAAHIPLPQFVNEDPDRDPDGASSASATASVTVSGTSQARAGAEEEIKVFSWQEKVFSRYEIELYKDLSNCHTTLQEQYHKEVTGLSHQSSSTDRLFTYVHNDTISSIEEDEDIATVGSESEPNYLVKAMRNLQVNQKYVPPGFLKRDRRKHHQLIIQESLGNTNTHLQGLPQATCQRMYIMADLSSSNDIGASEYVLCVIRWSPSSGALFVTPDLSGPPTATKPYRIEVDGDARNVYDYWLELASNSISEDEKTRELEVHSKVLSHKADLRKAHVGDEFLTCPIGTLGLYVFGQINSLHNFDDHNLFVHYFVDLPKGWTSDSPETISGISATSRARSECVHLGHPLQFYLKLNLSEFEDSLDSAPKWPQLMFEVLSLDWWGRFRTEGYGYVPLPTSIGNHNITAHTWRPISGLSSELRRFFVGGNPELDDLTYVGVPHQYEENHLGKYGVLTTPSGDLKMVLNVVLQSPVSPEQSISAVPTGLLERLSATTLVKSVNQVLAAFRKAHERMLAAKESIGISEESKKDFVSSSKQ